MEIKDELCRTYSTSSQIKFKTTMLKSSLCDYRDLYKPFAGTIAITGSVANARARQVDGSSKKVIFKNYAPASFTNCINEKNNVEVDNLKNKDIVMLLYNLIEYSDNYAKTLGNLW